MSRNRKNMSKFFILEIATFQDQNENDTVLSIINFTLKKNLKQIFLLMCK